jgi:hypothetical protein
VWVRLDDHILHHPKFLKAGRYLGRNGYERALATFVAGLCQSSASSTDGKLTHALVAHLPVAGPVRVAKILARPDVGLWHETPEGFQIHDFHDYNFSAAEIKAKRKTDRERKRAKRLGAA